MEWTKEEIEHRLATTSEKEFLEEISRTLGGELYGINKKLGQIQEDIAELRKIQSGSYQV